MLTKDTGHGQVEDGKEGVSTQEAMTGDERIGSDLPVLGAENPKGGVGESHGTVSVAQYRNLEAFFSARLTALRGR